MLWDFSNEQLLTSFAFIAAISFIGGWLADKILGYSGFTMVGNWLFLLLGTYVGLLSYNLLGHRFFWDSNFTMFLCIGSALAMLFTMLSIRAALHFR